MSKPDQQPKKKDIPDCAVCLQSCVHPVELPCSHVFCFLCMKGASTQYRRCALCRQEIPVDFFTSPKLLLAQDQEEEEEDEDPPESEEHYTWFYEGRNGWWQYDERTDAELEESYRANKRTFELLIAGYVYVIDLDSMLQYRRLDPSRRRRIKRDLVSAPKKGIAGLKIKVKREEESSGRHVDGAEEEKEDAGAVGGTASTPSDDTTDEAENECDPSQETPSGEREEKSDRSTSSRGTRTASPNASHSNSASDDSVYEVVRNSPPQRAMEQSPPEYTYNSQSPQSDHQTSSAVPSRPRRRRANEPSSEASQNPTGDPTGDGQLPSPPRTLTASVSSSVSSGVAVHHQRTHSAPETHSSRPRGPTPLAPPRSQDSLRSAQSSTTRTGVTEDNLDSDIQNLAEALRSELVVNTETNSGARRRSAHRHVHEVWKSNTV